MSSIDSQTHRRLACDLFNYTWSLMDKADRTPEDTDSMIHAAHASRHHWSIVGEAKNLSIGEWQISRVYSVLQRQEPALYHARRCLDISEDSHLKPFNLGYAHEALARAYSLTSDSAAVYHLEQARQFADQIPEPEDKKVLMDDLQTIVV